MNLERMSRISMLMMKKGAVNNIELPFHNIINTTERIGWAYIDGQKYFFDNKGNIAGNMPSKKVIDVSSYNGNIDWNTVKTVWRY